MGSRYVLQLLYKEYTKKLVINQQPLEPVTLKHRFGILRILENFNACLISFTNNQVLVYKIGWQFLVTTKLFIV